MEFFGLRPVGGALFGDHQHVSIMGVASPFGHWCWLFSFVRGVVVVLFLAFLLCNSGF
jgi:hypothetical protein